MMRLTSGNAENSPRYVRMPRVCFGAAGRGSWETAPESLDRIIYANVCAPHIIFVGGFAGEMRPASLQAFYPRRKSAKSSRNGLVCFGTIKADPVERTDNVRRCN